MVFKGSIPSRTSPHSEYKSPFEITERVKFYFTIFHQERWHCYFCPYRKMIKPLTTDNLSPTLRHLRWKMNYSDNSYRVSRQNEAGLRARTT